MDELKSFALVFCISSIISAIVVFLVPDGAFKKIFIQIVSLFLISILVKSVYDTDFSKISEIDEDFDVSAEQEEYSGMILEYMFDNGRKVTESEIRNRLDSLLSGRYSLDIVFDTDMTGAVCIEKITVFISEIDSLKTVLIKNKVGELTGIIPEVKINEQ